jgi:hypothetical protein
MAKAKLIDPIKSLHGSLASDHRYYLRTLHGKTIIQRKPDRSNHVATEGQLRAQKTFVKKYASKKRDSSSESR